MLRFLTAASMTLALCLGSAKAAPLEAYGRLPAIESVQISPDGSAIALIAAVNDERHVIVRSLAGQVLASASIGFRKVRAVQWAGPGHIVIEASSTTAIDNTTYAGEHWQAVSLNVATGEYKQLPAKALDSFLNILQGRVQPGVDGKEAVIYTPLYVTVAGNMQHRGGHLDLFRIDLTSGVARRLQMGDSETYDYLARSDGEVLAKASYRERRNNNDALWTLSVRKGSSWLTAYQTSSAVEAPSLWGQSVDSQSVIIDTWDAKEQLWRPTSVSLADGKLGAFIGPAREQQGVIGADGVVLGFRYRQQFHEYDFMEPRLRAIWPAFRGAFKNQQVTLSSWTPDFRKLVLFVNGGPSSGGYYLADTVTKRVEPIGAPYPKVPPSDVAPTRFVRYAATDGLEIEAVLTTPKGKPETALPLIVLPHGGPRAYDDITFDWWAQALASRGYAVLQPNFRGSSGYGHAFKEAGYGQWGAKMQTDLSDGVSDLVRQGVVDPKRVCILGASYGGYAALAGVTLQKDIYRCAVSIAGPSDLGGRLRDEIIKYGERNAGIRDRKRLYGVESASDPKLDSISPAMHASKAGAPVLIIHGKDDTVVPFAQSQRMADALKTADKPYELVVLPGEDHWLSTSVTRLQMLDATVAFLEKNNPPN
ncbi:S9 family peptidase [Caulobacter sp. RHG1]|uniref:alpha/beta hydrolase family protein n=1 Tax=Caulobacter sp. (strain RHG1) TaxID=2545762 RepID=UPI00155486FD|nr:S9 family peptidase [Caulobacter sp. RHG1]NQE60840.1 Prolyl oligopeptidase family protein [Caulobacter sp. RHG1]